jgi:MFS family permease
LTIGLVLTVTLIAFEGLAVATILPAIRDDLGGTALYGWVFSAFMLASVISTVMAGRAADRRGVGQPFAAGLLLFAAGLVVGAAAPSMLILVVGRAIQGLGAGAVSATTVTTVARGYPAHERPRVFALMSTAWVVPSLVGPGVSGVIAQTIGWRWVFAGLLPLLAISGGIAFPRLRRLRSVAGERGDEARIGIAVVLAITVAALLAGLDRATRVDGVALIAIGGAGAVAALRHLWPRGTLRASHGLPAAVLSKGVLTFAFFGTDAFVPLAVTSIHHRSVAYAGLPLTTAALTWTAGAWVAARAARTVAMRRVIAIGFALIACGIAAAYAGLSAQTPAAEMIMAWGIAGLGMGMAYQTITLAVLADAAPGQEGAASAAQQLADLLGIATGAGVVGALVGIGEARGWATGSALRVGFAITLVAAIAGVVLTRRLVKVDRDTSPTLGSSWSTSSP